MPKTKKILIIEDDVFLNKAYQTKLSVIPDTEIIFAQDGDDGFKKIVAEKPDLILLDLMLPKKSGFEILDEMSKSPGLIDIPVLVLSNLGQEDDIKKAESWGVKEYLVKSEVKLEEIVEKVKKLL